MSCVYVALGSNLGDRASHINLAAQQIEALAECSNLVCSSLYETAPMGPQQQPDYLNAVCRFECTLDPHELLAALKTLEQQHGRVQTTERWTARPLDLDIILFGQLSIQSDALTIPHVGVAHRSFVLWPLAELDDSLIIPGVGAVKELMQTCEQYGIRRLGGSSQQSGH